MQKIDVQNFKETLHQCKMAFHDVFWLSRREIKLVWMQTIKYNAQMTFLLRVPYML